MTRRLLPRRIDTVLTVASVVVALSVGAVAQAQAQTVPATNPAPAAANAQSPMIAPTTPDLSTQQVSQATGAPGISHTGFNVSHYPVIDIIPIYTEETLQNSHPGYTYQNFDVGGSVRIPISTKWSVSFDRNVGGNLNTAPERTLSPTTGAPTYNAVSRDAVLVYRTDWQFSPNWLLEGGLQFRHRLYAGCFVNGCPLNAAGNSQNSGISAVPFPYSNNSTEAHWGYLGLTYTTPAIHELHGTRFSFNITGDEQNADQNVAELCSSATAFYGCGAPGMLHHIIYLPEGALNTNAVGPLCTVTPTGTTKYNSVPTYSNCPKSYTESTQYVAAVVPVDRHITAVVNFTWGTLNYYENQEFPWRWADGWTYAVTDRFNPFVAFSIRWQNKHEDMIDIPYASPNVNHVGNFDAYFTFHVDTGNWFH
ncbi:MAG TPA: hypothetical protein VMD91_09805 [Candidatus Sulfotelmatobacter sp.]|nr:hypothetical protein [Candidatus Sulfotelmatobacter sp.]